MVLKRKCIDLQSNIDRVTAERDAALADLKAMGERYQKDLILSRERWCYGNRADAKIAELQKRLTAADERADVLEGLLREAVGQVRGTVGNCDDELADRIDAALKPAKANDSCELCKGWGFRANPDGADEGCGACNGTGKEPSDDKP